MNVKEQKWGEYRGSVVKRLSVLEGEGWVIVCTDGPARWVKGWGQAGWAPGPQLCRASAA